MSINRSAIQTMIRLLTKCYFVWLTIVCLKTWSAMNERRNNRFSSCTVSEEFCNVNLSTRKSSRTTSKIFVSFEEYIDDELLLFFYYIFHTLIDMSAWTGMRKIGFSLALFSFLSHFIRREQKKKNQNKLR